MTSRTRKGNVALSALAGRGRRVFDLSEFFRANMQWIKLFNAALFAAILVVTWVV